MALLLICSVLGIIVYPIATLLIATPLVVLMVRGQQNAKREARALCSPECACVHPAASFEGWSGPVQTFHFDNLHFATEFMAANGAKLINVSAEAQRLLVAKRTSVEQLVTAQRAAMQQVVVKAMATLDEPQRAALLAKEDTEYARWVGRIEREKGPAGRRAALEVALAMLTRPELRERLAFEASRIEVQAALDKVDGLKTPAAKLRTLRTALDVVRSDTVPDALQSEQIRGLEQAIAEVEVEQALGRVGRVG